MLSIVVKAILKHHRKIVAAWIILFILFLPFVNRLDEAIKYSEEEFIPKNIESNIGKDILSQYFEREKGEVHSILLAIRYNSSSYEDHDEVVRIIESVIETRGYNWIDRVISPTNAYEMIRDKYWEIMNASYNEIFEAVYENITELHSLLYELRNLTITTHDALYSAYDSYNSLGQVLYGIPFGYLEIWGEIYSHFYLSTYPDPKYNIYEVNALSQKILYNSIRIRYGGDDLDMILFYVSTFLKYWNDSFTEPYPDPSSIDNATLASLTINSIQNSVQAILINPFVPADIKESISEFVSNIRPNEWLDKEIYERKVIELSISRVYEEIIGLMSEIEVPLNITISKSMLMDIFELGRYVDYNSLNNYVLEVAVDISPAKYHDIIYKVYRLGERASEQSFRVLARNLTDQVFKDILLQHPPPKYPNAIISRDIGMLGRDRKTALIVLEYNETDVDSIKEVVNVLEAIISMEVKRGRVEEGYVTGEDVLWMEMEEMNRADIDNIDRMTVILVIVLLSILLSSFVAPLLPLITIGSAIFLAQGILYLLSTLLGFNIHYLSRSFLVTIMMGAGVDYAIYIIYRYFEERGEGTDIKLSVFRSGKFGGEAVLSSGATVMAGFGSLAISRVGILSSVGITLMFGILIALLTAVILIPSILMLIGDKVMWPRKKPPSGASRGKLLKKAAEYSVKKPWAILIIFMVVTLIFIPPTIRMSRSYDTFGMIPQMESKKGYDFIIDNFGSKYLSKVDLIIVLPEPILINGTINVELYKALADIITNLSDIDNIDPNNIYGPTAPYGKYVEPGNISIQDIESMRRFIGKDPRYVRYELGLLVIYTSSEAFDAVDDMRSSLKSLIYEKIPGSSYYVTGGSALLSDVLNLIDEDFYIRIIPTVLMLIYIILFILLRSVFIPVRLIITILMSILWSVGLLTIIFQFGIGIGIYWMIPILLFSLLMGLGMDYDIFLVSRIKEEVGRGKSDEDAIVKSVERTGLVITACGLILASALGTLMLSSSYILIESGFTLSVAIILDTFLVRIFLVPSIMMLLKRWNWWPGKPSVVEEL